MDYILNRRSVRKFDLTKEISLDTLKLLCRYAEAAPTARRQDSREYIIVNDQLLITKLSHLSIGAKILEGCNTIIAVIGKDPKGLATPQMQPQDLSAATENILIAATSMNIGSCWVGIFPHVDRMSAVKEALGIPDECFAFSLVALGIPKSEDAFYDAKKLKESSIHINRY